MSGDLGVIGKEFQVPAVGWYGFCICPEKIRFDLKYDFHNGSRGGRAIRRLIFYIVLFCISS